MWNTCWWYDCPEAARHYLGPTEIANSKCLESNSLWRQIERWRNAKQERAPGFRWLRSLRPPAHPLGTALRAILRLHTKPVTCVSFAPDGKSLLSGSTDQSIRNWDAQSGEQFMCRLGHEDAVTAVTFAPGGERFASASRDHTVRIWDSATGACVDCLRGHSNGVLGVAFFSDSRRIASVSADKTVRIWDTVETKCLIGHSDAVTALAVSPDGNRVVSGSRVQSARVWDAASGTELRSISVGCSVLCAAFAPDGKHFAAGSSDGCVRLWDTFNGHEVMCIRDPGSLIRCLAFSPDGLLIATGSRRSREAATAQGNAAGLVRIWQLFDGTELRCLHGHSDSVLGVAFSPDGRRVASASSDRTVRLWDLNEKSEPRRLIGHADVTEVYFIDDRLVHSESMDRTERLWDASTGLLLGEHTPVGGGLPRVGVASTRETPWRTVTLELETRIEAGATSQAVAWFPMAFTHVTYDSAGRTWAGGATDYFCLLALEGEGDIGK